MKDAFLQFLPKNQKYLVAVSGGMDSMALLHGMLSADYQLQVAHCNYQLRGADSDADEALVADFCTLWQIPLHTKRFDTHAIISAQKVGIQEGARQIRYAYFKKLCIANGLQAVVTAHHKGDVVETVLMNICRGTGLDGLQGIKSINSINNLLIVRPLLNLDKQYIQLYIQENTINYREDASNEKQDYLRNQIRHSVIPALQNADDRFDKTMMHNIANWTNVNTIYQTHIAKVLSKAMSQRGSEMYLHINAFRKLQPMHQWIFEALKPYHFSYAQCLEVIKIINAPNGKYVANNKYRVVKQHDFLIVTDIKTTDSDYIVINNDEIEIENADFQLQLSVLDFDGKITENQAIGIFDASKITYPFVLRKWKEGDYFYPLGMPKKKKIARFLIDQKMPLLQKEKTWVLLSNEKIIWVVGLRIDNRVKVSEVTKLVLKISVKRK